MQTEVAEKFYTVKEYLALEERAENKHEYFKGKIIKMPGAAYTHNRIATNILVELSLLLKEKEFEVLNSDTKIYIPQLQSFVYPDVLVVYEKVKFFEGRKDVITNPLMVIEVSSPSTKKYDRHLKFQRYKTLPSFKEYVLIEQSQPWVVASYKIADRTWQDTEATSLDGSVYLQSVDCTIEMKNIYHKVQFDSLP